MSEQFDPYRKWLGIPPEEQPANLYRLLGLSLFESDPDVVHEAADRQMAHVQRHKLGPYAALSQRLLNELSSAKLCLLKPDRKATYDRQLRDQLAAQSRSAASAAPIAPVVAVPATNPIRAQPVPVEPRQTPTPARAFVAPSADFAAVASAIPTNWTAKSRRKPRSTRVPTLAAGGVAAALLVGVGLLLISHKQPSQPEPATIAGVVVGHAQSGQRCAVDLGRAVGGRENHQQRFVATAGQAGRIDLARDHRAHRSDLTAARRPSDCCRERAGCAPRQRAGVDRSGRRPAGRGARRTASLTAAARAAAGSGRALGELRVGRAHEPHYLHCRQSDRSESGRQRLVRVVPGKPFAGLGSCRTAAASRIDPQRRSPSHQSLVFAGWQISGTWSRECDSLAKSRDQDHWPLWWRDGLRERGDRRGSLDSRPWRAVRGFRRGCVGRGTDGSRNRVVAIWQHVGRQRIVVGAGRLASLRGLRRTLDAAAAPVRARGRPQLALLGYS